MSLYSYPRVHPGTGAAVEAQAGNFCPEGYDQLIDFEARFAAAVGTEYAIGLNSGTAALHLALLAHGVKPGDEVIVSALCAPAVLNTILTAGATPVLIDCDPFTYTINPLEVERMLQRRSNGNGSAAHADATAGNEQRSGGGTTVLLADHLFGQPCEMRTLTQLADAHGLTLIEVAWEAFGARYDGRQVGHSGTAVFSFLEGMAINTAEGGVLTTNDARLAELVRVYANNGCDDDGCIVVPGFNYRMPYGTACVATEQLKLARRYSRPRHHNARELTHLLSDIRGVVPPMSLPGAEHAYQRYAVRLAREFPFSVEETRDRLRAREIWASCCELQSPYAHPYFREGNLSCGPLPETEAACRELLFIRLADQVEHEELVRIANELKTLSTGSAPQSH